ncbi:ASST-domain-containing protein [Mycena amicta]|nr:ASST-domain-containing protein [Mycena amicta]
MRTKPLAVAALLSTSIPVHAVFERTYHSSPLAIQPLTVLVRAPSYDPQNSTLFLVCPTGSAIAQPSPVIYDSTGELVWADPTIGGCNDLNLQTYNGKKVLTFWAGNGNPGTGVQVGNGTARIFDEAYRSVANVSAVNPGGGTDLHEFRIVQPENKTALVTAYTPVPADLSVVGGPKEGWYLNAIIQEVDIASGRVLFNWTSFDHIALTESYNNISQAEDGLSSQTAWDAVHINSIEKDSHGNYLISARHTWTVYNIDGRDGQILWRLGGKNSSFTVTGNDTADAQFHWQHDARWRGSNVISLFDDGAAVLGGTFVINEPVATGKFFQLDLERKTVQLVNRFIPAPNAGPSFAEGSTEVYGSQVVVGYGSNPWLTVHDLTTQQLLFSAVIGPNNSTLWLGGITNYRVYQTSTNEFIGRPQTTPAVTAERDSLGALSVYVSWNGATQVVNYALLTGADAGSVKGTLRTVQRTGFETQISGEGSEGYVQVAALAKDGSVLGTSAVVPVPTVPLV